MTRHVPVQDRHRLAFDAWLAALQRYALTEADMVPDVTAAYWRECFDDGMSPEQAFRESFTEQDSL
jgi:hypothetical protein